MSSVFPIGKDNLSTSHATGDTIVASTDNAQADAINKIQDFLVPSLNTQTGVSYTLVAADMSKIVGMSNASANTVTVPANSSVAFPVGAIILIRQVGAGQTNIAPDTGVTINSRGGLTHLAGQYAYATLVKVATDTWELSGDIA